MPRMVFLALFFLAGVCLGQVLAGRVPREAGRELSEYLQHYVTVEGGVTGGAVLSALVLYLRYPLLAALLGFASIGVVLLPWTVLLFGFFLVLFGWCVSGALEPTEFFWRWRSSDCGAP